jgi:hypothetical protein
MLMNTIIGERAKTSVSRATSTSTEGSGPEGSATRDAIIQNRDKTNPPKPQAVEGIESKSSKGPQPQGCMTSVPEVRALMHRFADHAYNSYAQGKPVLEHLPLLVRYNVAISLATNAGFLGIATEFYDWEGISPMNKHGPSLGPAFCDHSSDWPATLHPTQLQLSIKHHPWVDCFPWPRLRDNLLQAFEHPDLCDEDELCHDICDFNDQRESMLMVWGPPEDSQNWEVSDSFLRKWAWLLKDCGQVLVSTNYWRSRRGELVITPQQFADFVWASLPKRLHPSGRLVR